MSTIRRVWVGAASVVGLLALSANAAHAVCTINAAGLSVTPATGSTGTYTPPTAPTDQAINLTISGTYLSLAGGTCTVGIAFNRASLPASMMITGGGSATLPYTIRSVPGGGDTLLYTGGGVPPLANILTVSFPATILGLAVPFSVNATPQALAIPGSPQVAGTYSDSVTLNTFNVTILNVVTALTSTPFTVTGIVAKSCTIGGVAHPGADTATIPIGPTGAVDTSPIAKSYLNALCNTPSNLQLTSQGGAVKTAATPVSGFTNSIDYTATASFSGANASLNTATNPATTGPETGTAVSTTGGTPSGTLSATITPHANVLRLLPGAYSDTLAITITPQ